MHWVLSRLTEHFRHTMRLTLPRKHEGALCLPFGAFGKDLRPLVRVNAPQAWGLGWVQVSKMVRLVLEGKKQGEHGTKEETSEPLGELLSGFKGSYDPVLLGTRVAKHPVSGEEAVLPHWTLALTEECARHIAARLSEGEPEKKGETHSKQPSHMFENGRKVAALVSPGSAGIIAQGKSLLDWQRTHQFCGVCGSKTRPKEGGTKRQCLRVAPGKGRKGREEEKGGDTETVQEDVKYCGADLYPRTDPVVIMLVISTDGCTALVCGRVSLAGRLNMTHTRARPICFVIGFIDAGETIEDAVRREVLEESGVRVGKVVYHSCQPWPFNHQLMIGCHAFAISDDIEVDKDELDEAIWCTKEKISRGLEMGKDPQSFYKNTEHFRLPPPYAIAHKLCAAWTRDTVASL